MKIKVWSLNVECHRSNVEWYILLVIFFHSKGWMLYKAECYTMVEWWMLKFECLRFNLKHSSIKIQISLWTFFGMQTALFSIQPSHSAFNIQASIFDFQRVAFIIQTLTFMLQHADHIVNNTACQLNVEGHMLKDAASTLKKFHNISNQ